MLPDKSVDAVDHLGGPELPAAVVGTAQGVKFILAAVLFEFVGQSVGLREGNHAVHRSVSQQEGRQVVGIADVVERAGLPAFSGASQTAFPPMSSPSGLVASPFEAAVGASFRCSRSVGGQQALMPLMAGSESLPRCSSVKRAVCAPDELPWTNRFRSSRRYSSACSFMYAIAERASSRWAANVATCTIANLRPTSHDTWT